MVKTTGHSNSKLSALLQTWTVHPPADPDFQRKVNQRLRRLGYSGKGNAVSDGIPPSDPGHGRRHSQDT